MHVQFTSRGFDLTEGLREHAERRLSFALGWADSHIRKVAVRLSDENGPRGGSDKRCHVQIAFESGGDVVIEDTESDLYVAIDRAADRAGRTVARRLDKQREHPHIRLDTSEPGSPEPTIH